MMSFTGAIVAGSLVKVMRIHSSASADDESDGFHASRPNACQLAHENTEPHQLRSVPVLATPAKPVTTFRTSPCLPERPDAVPWGRCVSAFSTSSKSGPRYTRWVAKPRYSFVI